VFLLINYMISSKTDLFVVCKTKREMFLVKLLVFILRFLRMMMIIFLPLDT